MSEKEKPNYRMERLSRLFKEIEYEITRGMMEGELDEQLGFRFVVPISKQMKGGVVHCEFRSYPTHFGVHQTEGARLKVVK